MLKTKNSESVECVLSYLPTGLSDEISRILGGRRDGAGSLHEIRIRAEGRSSLVFGCESVPLYYTVKMSEAERVVAALCDGALYAYRDSLANGYLTIAGGIRVGVCGYARYEGGALVGVSDMRSLVFRLPAERCEVEDEIYEAFRRSRRGMLIYSPPGIGKTTALRSLAASVGSGHCARRVCVIDERCEFRDGDYVSCEVDILKGYKRRAGIEIATRTMSPEVIMIDEIGGDDAESIRGVLNCGIPIVATAHASSLNEIKAKPSLAPLLDIGVFDVFAGISREGGVYSVKVDGCE